MVLVQAIVVALLALVWLMLDARAALSVMLGGGSATLGSALMAWRSFSRGVVGPYAALFGVLGGIALKWLVIVVALYLALARWALPALPLLAGLAAAMIAPLLAFRMKSQG